MAPVNVAALLIQMIKKATANAAAANVEAIPIKIKMIKKEAANVALVNAALNLN